MAYSPTGEIFNASGQRRFENMMKLLLFLEAELQLKEEIIDLLLVCIVQFWYYFYLVYLKVAKVYTDTQYYRSRASSEPQKKPWCSMLYIEEFKIPSIMNVLFQTDITLWRSFFPIILHVNSFPLRSLPFEFRDFFHHSGHVSTRDLTVPWSFENIQSNTPYITLRNKTTSLHS